MLVTTGSRRHRQSTLTDERGSILPLLIGSCVLALALIFGVISATSLYVERKRLFSLADGAALVAAESYDLSAVPRLAANGLPELTLSGASVLAGAQTYLANTASDDVHQVQLLSATTPDARTAVIRLRAPWHPPVLSYFFPAGFPLEVEAQARTIR